MSVPSDAFAPIDDAVADIAAGRFVVVVDTAEEHGWGGLVVAAEHATPAAVNFMLTEARGPLYLCLSYERCAELGLSVVGSSPLRSGAAFMISIEARHGITSGVSAEDRATTIRSAADQRSKPSDFVYPGHLPVLRARRGGVLERARQLEAAVDLARLAGLHAAGALAEILTQDGTAATGAALLEYCRTHGLTMVSVADLVLHRRQRERVVERTVTVRMPTEHGLFDAVGFRDAFTGEHHVAFVKGEVDDGQDVLVRVHTQCLTGDVFHSTECDCRQSLDTALARVEAEGRGVVLYISQPERGLRWLWQRAQELDPDAGPVARPSDEQVDVRDYGIGSEILVELGIRRVRVLTDHVRDLGGVAVYGLTVVEQVPLLGTARTAAREAHRGHPVTEE